MIGGGGGGHDTQKLKGKNMSNRVKMSQMWYLVLNYIFSRVCT